MTAEELIQKLLDIKEEKGYTLHDLSKILDIQIPSIDRWFRTRRINRIYAQLVKEKLNIE